MGDFIGSGNSRLFAIYETDTHKRIVFEAKWGKPMTKEPYLEWVQVGPTTLEEDG